MGQAPFFVLRFAWDGDSSFFKMDHLELVREVVKEPIRSIPFNDRILELGLRCSLCRTGSGVAENQGGKDGSDEEELFHRFLLVIGC